MTFPQFFGTSQRRPINQDGRSKNRTVLCWMMVSLLTNNEGDLVSPTGTKNFQSSSSSVFTDLLDVASLYSIEQRDHSSS